MGPIQVIDEHTATVLAGSDDAGTLALGLGFLGADFTVTDSPELSRQLRMLAGRYQQTAG